MPKTLTFKHHVHLSEKYGGIKHGEDLESPDIKRGTTLEIANDKLANLLIEQGNAEELKVEGKPAKKDKTGGN